LDLVQPETLRYKVSVCVMFFKNVVTWQVPGITLAHYFLTQWKLCIEC